MYLLSFHYKRLLLGVVSYLVFGVLCVNAQSCTLRIGAFLSDIEGIVGMGDRPISNEILDGVVATAINKATDKSYESSEIDGLRYFNNLTEGRYRIILSKVGYKTTYDPYELKCGNDPWSVSTWYMRMSPGSSKEVMNRDPENRGVKEMRLDRMTKLGNSDSDTEAQIQPVISGGESISLPEPRISSRAKGVNFVGVVKVLVDIDPTGKVIHAKAISGHPLLLADCETAAYYSKFSPRIVNGRPTWFFTAIRYPFGAAKTVSGGVLNGKALVLPKPAYPPAAKAVRAGGSVSVQVLIDENGNVISASAISGHPLLQSAAVEAARAAKFTPTLLLGVPVKVSGVITYNFVP